MEGWIAGCPLRKFVLDGSDDFFQGREIAIVQTLTARQLPDSLADSGRGCREARNLAGRMLPALASNPCEDKRGDTGRCP